MDSLTLQRLNRLRDGLRAAVSWPLATRPRLYALSTLLHLVFAPFFIHDWDGFVFVQVARDALAGVTPYSLAQDAPPYIFVGDAVPVVNTWYAYPPIALLLMVPPYAVFTLLSSAPWMERLAIKLPWIVGDLLLAYLCAKLVVHILRARASERATLAGRSVERALLLNPFLIFISAVWGMFDVWMLVLLVLSLLLLEQRRYSWAGAAFAGSVMVKLFPAFLGPALVALAWRRGGAARTLAMVATGMATGLVVCLPFFLDAPGGFLTQVLTNHAQRPPQGFTLIGLPLAFPWINGLVGTNLPEVAPEALSSLSFLLLMVMVGVLHLSLPRVRTTADFLSFALVLLVGILLVSKVVNEQYFLMPVVLATLAHALLATRSAKHLMRAYTWGGVASGLVLGWHFVTFIPHDVATALFPWPPGETVARIQARLGWSGEEAFVYPTLLAAAALLPALVLSIREVASTMVATVRPLLPRPLASDRTSRPTAALIVLLILGAPFSTTVLAETEPASAPPAPVELPSHALAVAYDMRWHNPSHDPRVPAGGWAHTMPLTPTKGYYSSSAGRIAHDFETFREAGATVVLLNARGDLFMKAPAVSRAAELTGLATIPSIDLEDLQHNPARQPTDKAGAPRGPDAGFALSQENQDEVAARIVAALRDLERARPAHVDGARLVWLPDPLRVSFDHSPAEHARTLDAAADLAQATMDDPPSRAELALAYPDAAWREDNLAPLWASALAQRVETFWREVREEVEAEAGPVILIAGLPWSGDGSHEPAALGRAFDAVHAGSAWSASQTARVEENAPSIESRMDAWRSRQSALQERPTEALRVATVPAWPAGDAPLAPRLAFLEAVVGDVTRSEPRLVVLDSWNRFDRGMAFEPTVQDGERLWTVSKTAAPRP